MRAYLDHNATSPLRPAARAAILDALDHAGNASSIHGEGRKTRGLIDSARENIAAALGVLPQMITFTSGGTEANNLAIKGAPVERLIISTIEHPSVIEAAKTRDLPIDWLPVDATGTVRLDELDAMLKQSTLAALVSVMLVNNETGVIQPVREIVELARTHNALIHTDAVQALGKVPVNFGLLGCDMMTISAHKFGGPAGTGALIIREGVPLVAHIHGGGQELRRRAGTENAAAIAGFAAAVGEGHADLGALRSRLESELESCSPGVVIFGREAERISNTSCFALAGLSADTALISLDLDGVAVSSGSACSSGKVAGSHVLKAMGVPAEIAKAAIRVSLGWNSTVQDIETFIDAWRRIVDRNQLRSVMAGREPTISGRKQIRYPNQVRA
jgi:cysteine desulfurase